MVAHPGLRDLLLPPGHPDHRLEYVRRRFLLAGRPLDIALNILVPGALLSVLPLAGVALAIAAAGPSPIRSAQARLVDFTTTAAVLGIWVSTVCTLHALWQLSRYRSSGRFRRELQRLGRCVACGYDLRGLEPDHDDCVCCPECGAAWALADAGSRPFAEASARPLRTAPLVLSGVGRRSAGRVRGVPHPAAAWHPPPDA